MADGEETICINPCKWFEQALKATLRCLGLESVITSESPQADDDQEEECLRTEPLIFMGPNGSDDHKEKDGDCNKPVIACADTRGSGSSSSSSSGDGHQDQQTDLNPSTTDPGSADPTSESSSDPSVLALGRSRMPPRPPVSSGRGGQTN